MSEKLSFDIYSCVKVYYRYADCNRCVEVCPISGAIFIENDKVNIDLKKCIDCGACVGNCPTESFKIKGFDPNQLVNDISSTEDSLISCKLNVPCASALDSQHLITMVLNKNSDVIIDIGYCNECQISGQIEVIKKNVEEANYVLYSTGVPFRVKMQSISYQPKHNQANSRRAILKLFAKKTAALAFWAIEDKINMASEEKEAEREIKNIVSEKVIPLKRVKMLNSLSKLDVSKDRKFHISNISFTSDKWIDESVCTNCGICGNICPTGAITNSDDRLKNLFNPSLCIKCKICHDVCPEKCLHLKDELSVYDFIQNKYKVLASHVMIACSECLVPFSYKGDSTVCPRCRQLEDEIRELLKIGD